MPSGKDFIKHEFDEAIAIQQCIVESGKELSQVHPVPAARTALKELQPIAEQHLETLQSFGANFGAKGKKEDVVKGMEGLMNKVLTSAKEKGKEEESEVYEAHAVLLSLFRKQQDSAPAVKKIATELGDRKLVIAANKMKRELDAATKQLNELLGDFAVRIATQPEKKAA
jgi:phosphoglycolate phosphatase-like HAD superfamily hydrolase